jgi:hypothetical protein
LYRTHEGITIDVYSFDIVDNGSILELDVLSWEQDVTTGRFQDVRQDRQSAYFDSKVFLIQQDYVVAVNDDYAAPTADGSIHLKDAFLNFVPSQGLTYVVVGTATTTIEEALKAVRGNAKARRRKDESSAASVSSGGVVVRVWCTYRAHGTLPTHHSNVGRRWH